MNFLKKVSFAYKYLKSHRLCRERNYSKAYDMLKTINLVDIKLTLFIEYLALRGAVAFRIREFEDAADCFEGVFKHASNTNEFCSDEVLYIEAFSAKQYVEFKDKVSNITSAEDIEIKLQYDKFELRNVRNRLKRNFPLRSHPQWIEDD